MSPTSKTITEAEMLELLGCGTQLPPLEIRLASRPETPVGPDAVVKVTWGARVFVFDAELKARSTPSAFEAAVHQSREYAARSGRYPMVVLPHLRAEQLEALERRQISGIDLCGNGLVIVPGELLVLRSGAPNRYRESAPTKYAYRGTTSLVPRVFLCRAEYNTVGQIEQEIRARGGGVALSSVSKALKRMEEDVLIERTRGRIRLLQPTALLEKLAVSYREPRTRRRVSLALRSPLNAALAGLAVASRVVLSGASSAVCYAVMGRADCPVLYCEDINDVLEHWREEAQEARQFADVELCETKDQVVFFDTRNVDGVPYAPPTQTYFELARGDRRDQQTAEQVRRRILEELGRD